MLSFRRLLGAWNNFAVLLLRPSNDKNEAFQSIGMLTNVVNSPSGCQDPGECAPLESGKILHHQYNNPGASAGRLHLAAPLTLSGLAACYDGVQTFSRLKRFLNDNLQLTDSRSSGRQFFFGDILRSIPRSLDCSSGRAVIVS